MDKKLIKEFRNPGSQYRGAPFWAWNGKLEPDELRRQIRVMHRMGLGGFFMHSRVGLNTAYLSKEWFEAVNACIDEAEKLDMQAWLYDEDRWPSGAAGGLVTKNPKYRMRSLKIDVLDKPAGLKWTPETLAVFTARLDKHVATNVKRLAKGSRPRTLAKGESILRCHVAMDDCSDWYNGYTYLDTLSHEAVREFIKVTHEAYRKNIGRHFGGRVPGIFTDEPNYGHTLGLPWSKPKLEVPWTPKLPQVFRRRYGYDLIPRLLEVFFDVDGVEVTPARWQYHDCITHLFVDAFNRQIGEWCEKHNMQYTGHMLAEETLSSQTAVVGNTLRSYEYMQAPGMDILTEHSRQYDTAKQVSSVARQFGRKWRLTETYGCTGWDFPFVGHKAVGDWQAALGINLRCQHLSWYTMEGQAKRDYPAGIFYQSPWWELYPKVEDYFARVHAVMTRGSEVRDLLVIHPVESMWVTFRYAPEGVPGIKEMDAQFIALRDSLLTANIDFDYGDEEMLSRLGRVTRKGGEAALRVNKAEYRSVIVPPLKTIRSSTLKLLKAFRAAGGQVVFAGDVAGHVDARPSTAAAQVARLCERAPAKGPALARSVEKTTRRVSILDEAGRPIRAALHLLREDRDALYLFVCNTGETAFKPRNETAPMVRDKKLAFADVRIRGFEGCAGQPLEFDADSGRIYAAAAARRGAGWEIRTSLPAIGSRLFVLPKRRGGGRAAPRKLMKTVRAATLGGREWDIRLSEANNLVLDTPRFKIGDAPWQKPLEVLRVDRLVREAIGVKPRGGQMVQPWARPPVAQPKRTTVQLAYTFAARAVPSGDLFLALEQPKTFAVTVNGTALSMDAEAGWWCDQALRRIPVDPALIRLGRNEIVLTCEYSESHPGLEIVYLLGNFGSVAEGAAVALTPAPASLKIGDWVKQGLAFYSGSVAYCRTVRPSLRKGERLFVEAPAWRGVGVRVLVNGKSAGVIAWEPNEVDVTDFLQDGPNRLEIEVLGHRRNSHGPLHYAEKWPRWTGPGEYTYKEGKWVNDYQLVPCGLMAAPRLVVKR